MSKGTQILRVGDTVLYRCRFAKVLHIELCHDASAYGVEVSAASWSERDRIVVDLDNGHWAYGAQIEPVEDEAQEAAAG